MKNLLLLFIVLCVGCKEEKNVKIEINGKTIRINRKIDMIKVGQKVTLAKIESHLKIFASTANEANFKGSIKSFEDTKNLDNYFFEEFPKLQNAGSWNKVTCKFTYDFSDDKWTGDKVSWIIVNVKFDNSGAIYRLLGNQDGTVETIKK